MLAFVDCEAYGDTPVLGRLTEFGCVLHTDFETPVPELPAYHGILLLSEPDPDHPAIPLRRDDISDEEFFVEERRVFTDFTQWLREQYRGGFSMVSDNPAFDFQWVNAGFWRGTGRTSFGHSARRISDFYAGLTGEWSNTQEWKRWRVTPHDHNPVHDAQGNVEAFRTMMAEMLAEGPE